MTHQNQASLAAVLALTQTEIKILEGDLLMRKVPASQALSMIREGTYDWGGSTKRVRWMRYAGPAPKPWLPCWRTTDSAVLPPSPTYLASLKS